MGGHVSTSKQKKIGRTDGHENPTPKVVSKNKMTSKLLKNKFVVESHSIPSAGINGQDSGVQRRYDGGQSARGYIPSRVLSGPQAAVSIGEGDFSHGKEKYTASVGTAWRFR